MGLQEIIDQLRGIRAELQELNDTLDDREYYRLQEQKKLLVAQIVNKRTYDRAPRVVRDYINDSVTVA